MLKVESIVKYYGTQKAVDHLSFTVAPGEIFGLLGENGAGKTTTFRIIMGLLDASEGKVTLDGKKIDYDQTDKIGFMTEERSLLSKLTVKEQILFYGSLKGMKEDAIETKLDHWLKRFEIEDYKNRKIKELSKGNQQKIQFISAVINDPKLLILDEPFTGLDPINVKMLKDAIWDLQKQGCSIIFSSHQMEHIEEFCEKMVILVKGNSILNGDVKTIKKEFGRSKVRIDGKIKKEDIREVEGVVSITNTPRGFEVKIENEEVIDKLWKKIRNFEITCFEVLEPTLNEIFIEKVGAYSEK